MRSPLFHKALADVLRRPVRTILVLLGILIGVMGLTAINVTNDAITGALNYSANETRAANIIFYTQSVDPALAPQLAALPNVQDLQLVTSESTRWQVPAAPGHVNINIAAYADPTHVTVDPFQVTSGRLPNSGEIALDFTDSTLSPVELGDTITVDGANGPVRLLVVGLTRTLGLTSAGFNGAARGIMTAADMRTDFGLNGPNVVQAHVSDPSQIKATLLAMRSILLAHGAVIEGLNYDPNPFGPGPLPGLFTIMRVMSLIALVLSAILIFNTITTLVTEQTKIIGTMKAIGGSRGTIVRSYLTSVLIYGLAGTTLGLVAGLFGGFWFTSYITSIIALDIGPFQVSAGVIALSIAIGMLVPLASALWPLWNGTRITVRDAMAAYGVSAGNGGATDRSPRRIRGVPQIVLLGARGLFRRPGRAALTLVTLALAGTAFLGVYATTPSVNPPLRGLFGTDKLDITLGVNPTTTARLQSALATVPNIARVEREGADVLPTKWGYLLVQGFQPDTQVYRYHLIAGRWFDGDEPGAIIISDLVAQRTGLKVGGTLTLDAIVKTETFHIVGEVHDLNGGTGLIGTSITTINDLINLNDTPPDQVTGALIIAQDRSTGAVNQLATAIDTTLSAQGLNPSVATRQQYIQRSQSQFQIIYYLLGIIAVIVGLVGILGLANTLTTSVLERRREIGILRSMGASSLQVATVFWVEGLSLGAIAWVVAVVLGVPAALGFVALISQELVPLQFSFNPLGFGLMLVIMAAIATLASFGPALSASRARIADILRYE